MYISLTIFIYSSSTFSISTFPTSSYIDEYGHGFSSGQSSGQSAGSYP
jgi:hypothetical protein